MGKIHDKNAKEEPPLLLLLRFYKTSHPSNAGSKQS
jgi:hypothetical protein